MFENTNREVSKSLQLVRLYTSSRVLASPFPTRTYMAMIVHIDKQLLFTQMTMIVHINKQRLLT